MKFIRNSAIALVFVGVVAVAPAAHAETTMSIEDMLALIQDLLAQVEELQAQLNTVRGDIKDIIATGLEEGMTDEDIAKVQELLATDPSIYPEGLVTGYFGPLTKAALKRFQSRHGVPATGEISEDTRDLLNQYLEEGFGDNIPPGLLRAPGIAKKVEEGLCDGDKHRGSGPLCKTYKAKWGMDDDDDDDDMDDDDSDDSDDDDSDDADDDDDSLDYEVTITVEDGVASVDFTYDGDEEDVVADADIDDVLAEIAAELEMDVEDLDGDFVDDVESALEDAVDAAQELFDVSVSVDNGTTTVEFTIDSDDYEVVVESTDEDDVLDAVADAINEGDAAEDLDEELESAIKEELADALS